MAVCSGPRNHYLGESRSAGGEQTDLPVHTPVHLYVRTGDEARLVNWDQVYYIEAVRCPTAPFSRYLVYDQS
jgi:hypothetical protein